MKKKTFANVTTMVLAFGTIYCPNSTRAEDVHPSTATGICAAAPTTKAVETVRVVLGGEVGAAADASIKRFSAMPYDSLAWIRADLTGERASEFDNKWDHPKARPFKSYSGDISGRFIEIMALNSRGDLGVHPALKDLLADVPKLQRAGGYVAPWRVIDWQQPINSKAGGAITPALWGNARMLCGLVEACRAFNDPALLACAERLGDFYVGMIPRFTDPAKMPEYTGNGTYASGYVTCYFPAMEGLVKLHRLTGQRKYLDAAITMAEFYRSFDHLPIDHSHGMLCSQVGLLLLYEVTKQPQYLQRVEKRWDELVDGGYINPAGGILEKCYVSRSKDEGCAIADWLRLNLELADVTAKPRYLAMAERTLHNHLLMNQTPTGGFGHRQMMYDAQGVIGFKKPILEATWCCTFHGQLAFINLRSHLATRTATALTSNFALDFTMTDGAQTVTSTIEPGAATGQVLRQRIRASQMPAMILRVRHPHWADAVTAVDADGKALDLVADNGFLATARPVSEAVFIYAGGVYAENRHCTRLPAGPVAGESFVLGYGPTLLGTTRPTYSAVPAWPASIEQLQAMGVDVLTGPIRRQECRMVCTGTAK